MPAPEVGRSKGGGGAVVFVLLTAWFLVASSSALAGNPAFLGEIPPEGAAGPAAGQLRNPQAIAADPSTGNVYVAELQNGRVSEFTPWGVFIKMFGWGVGDGSPEPEVCTEGCEAGLRGDGPGQLDVGVGIAVDSRGDVYVEDTTNFRVEKFDSTGKFLLMFGGEVDKTTGGNVCTAAEVAGGDECGAGLPGAGPGEFGEWELNGRTLDIGPTDEVYVGDHERVQVFDSAGSFTEEIKFSAVPGLPSGTAGSLAVGPSGAIYLGYAQSCNESPAHPGVYKLDRFAHAITQKFDVACPKALDLDEEEHLYVVARALKPPRDEVFEFGPDGACIVCLGDGFGLLEEGEAKDIATASACGPTDIYVSSFLNEFLGDRSFFSIYGPPPNPAVCPPPVVPPTIKDQFASSVDSETATVKAAINPHFWPDTTYYVEYGTEVCASSACKSQPLPPGTSLGGQVVNNAVTSAGVLLHGLAAGTTYHYRFVAQSGGGGPVVGPDATFTTFPSAVRAPDSCPNAPFRTGFGASLPDCRAYEMVSPLDKEGADISALKNVFGYPATMNQSDIAGARMTYSAAKSFGDAQSGAYTSQYLATRTATGWSSEGISPARNGPIYERGFTTDAEFKAFSPDLCKSWLRHDSDPPLAAGAPAGFANLYRRQGCGAGEASYEALRTPAPPSTPPVNYEAELQGIAADGNTAIFVANGQLAPEAPPGKEVELYESHLGEDPRYVCILPNESADTGGCSAGTYNSSGGGFGRSANVQGAISEDGSRIFWSDVPKGEGKLYLRLGGTETRTVSTFAEGKSKTKASHFWAAATDGRRAIFTSGGDLWEYDVETGVSSKIAAKVSGLMGVSRDAGHVYFVSEEALEGAALAGRANLYLSVLSGEEHQITFVAEVATADAKASTLQQIPSAANAEPIKHVAHVSPDGEALAFMSTVRPAPGGFDNTDANSGKPDAEIYIYDAASKELHCVSCNRTGARPRGRELEIGGFTTGLWAAAELPPWENQLYEPRVLSAGGDRLYFEAYDPLVPTDTNSQLDLYQWEAPGSGSCRQGEGSYVPVAGGCIDMISTGQSPYPSEFVDATPEGEDVFFTTLSSLVPQDYGLLDIYDARAGGGFAPPGAPPAGCEGAACQRPPPAPAPPSPSSQSFQGPGSPAPAKKKSCPKGKRLVKEGAKQRCVAKKKHRKAANAGRARR